jgi:hypothetical protein
MLVGIGAALRAILVSSANSTNEALARSEVQKVASWIGDDVAGAQNVSLGSNGGFPLIISWTTPPPGNVTGSVTYDVHPMKDKVGRTLWSLSRTTNDGTATAAQYLKPFDPTNPLSTTRCFQKTLGNGTLENVLVMNVFSQVDAYSASGSYEISPRAFNVDWGALAYTLSYTAGANGHIAGDTSQTVIPGGNGTTVEAIPDNINCFFVRWSDGVLTASRTDTNVQHNIWVTAVFGKNTYTITASASSGGSISPSGAVTVNYGGNRTFSITANSGYCTTVVVDGVSAGNLTSYQFINVTDDHTIAATFFMPTISASAGAGGSISPSGNVLVSCGGNQAFTITANTGYHITNVVVDSVSKGNVTSYQFTNVTTGHTIAASFAINTYTITTTPGPNGTITPANPVVNYGASQTFSITPNTGYHIGNVTVDGVSRGNVTSYTFSNVTANHTIAASFAINTYTVTPSAGTGGSLNPSTPQTVSYNQTTSFTVTANTHYHIASVTGCGGTLSGNTYTTGPITGNCTVTATFAIDTYTVTPSAGTGGSLNPSTPQTVNYGNTTSFTVTANTGYSIASVTGCGGTLSGNTYTTGPITGNCTVTATFAINTYTITASAGTGGSISPSGAVVVNYGGNRTFTITASGGYCISGVLVDGGSVGKVTSYTFSNVTATHTIAASFASYSNTGSNHPSYSASGTFTSPDNAFSSNNVYASASNGQSESYANFRSTFTIPSGATIMGIYVGVEAKKSSGSTNNFDVSLSWDGGGNFTATENTGQFTGSDTTRYVGSATDTWSRTWSPSDFSDANFRVRLKANTSGTLYLDYVQVIVYYCP